MTSSGPATAQHLVVSPSGSVVWVVDGANETASGALWQYASGTWTKITAAGATWHTVAVDPAHPTTRILLGEAGGQINIGTVSGTSVTLQGLQGNPPTRSCTNDVPWLCTTNEYFMTSGDFIFDPALSNTALHFEGIGVWTLTPPGSGSSYTANSISSGIENLVVVNVIAPNGKPIVGAEDRAIFSPGTSGAYPANTLANFNTSLSDAWQLDWASTNTSFMVANNTPETSDIDFLWIFERRRE